MLIFEREDAQSDAWLWAGRKLAGRGAGHGMSHSNSHSSSHSSASSNSESNHQQLLVRSLQPELVQRKMTETEPNLIVIDRRSPSRTREADALCRWPNSPSNSLVSLCPTNSTIKGTLLDIPTVKVLQAALTKASGKKYLHRFPSDYILSRQSPLRILSDPLWYGYGSVGDYISITWSYSIFYPVPLHSSHFRLETKCFHLPPTLRVGQVFLIDIPHRVLASLTRRNVLCQLSDDEVYDFLCLPGRIVYEVD